MGTRTPALYLALLASLFAADAAASPTGSDPSVTDVQLAFSQSAASALPIDVQALAEVNCETSERPAPLGQCRLVFPCSDCPPTKGIIINPGSDRVQREAPEIVQWQATVMNLVGEPVMTSCGSWEVSLSLDPDVPQPISSMILKPGAGNPERGLFSTVLEMNLRLHLANEATGQVVDHPLGLGIGLAGSWSLTASEGLREAQGTLDLILQEYCLPMSLLEYPAYLELYLSGECRFCEDGAFDPSGRRIK